MARETFGDHLSLKVHSMVTRKAWDASIIRKLSDHVMELKGSLSRGNTY